MGMRGWAVTCWLPMVMVADRRGRRALRILLMLSAGACLGFAGDGQGGKHDGQMGLDAVLEAVEDRSRGQVGLGHPEGALDLVEVVVGGHDRRVRP